MTQSGDLKAVRIERVILMVRGQKVIIDSQLAVLYGVSTGRLNEQVTRNLRRFPPDFVFVLTREEADILISQNAISRSRRGWGGHRKLPRVFTEHGVAMLSSVLKSERAIQVNIEIVRVFVRLRHLLATHQDLARRLDELEHRVEGRFRVVFEVIEQLMTPPYAAKRLIGFYAPGKTHP